MRRNTNVSALIYNRLYPNPTPSEPQNFAAHLAKHLVPEIRIETARFYGSLDSIEARYPGLNYTYRPHVIRLSRFANHARLFKVFKQLQLTDSEILDLVRWEGTLWARDRFERDEGIKVADTTGDRIKPWVPPSQRPPFEKSGRKRFVNPLVITGEAVKVADLPVPSPPADSAVPSPVLAATSDRRAIVSNGPVIVEQAIHAVESELEQSSEPNDEDSDEEDEEEEEDEEDDDDDDEQGGEATPVSGSDRQIEDVDFNITRGLMAAVLARSQAMAIDMDPDFEEYLKQQVESGQINPMALSGMTNDSGDRSLASILNIASSMRVSERGPSSNATVSQPAA